MHVYFSGIGGTAIGPLALIARQAGYEVSGSDKQNSDYINYLKSSGINDIYIGQQKQQIEAVHAAKPIDWLVYSSAVAIENPDHVELVFARQNKIRLSKRDELLNEIIFRSNKKLIAIAGTHGKTTTTAMVVWLLKNLGLDPSYSVGAKISFGEMGHFSFDSEYFVYECDEYDHNFLAFQPYLSLITGIAYDHHDVFKTESDYRQAFVRFLNQSRWKVIWNLDFEKLDLTADNSWNILQPQEPYNQKISLVGEVNRQNAWLATQATHELTQVPLDRLISLINAFPGVSRRFEQIKPGLYSDYAHTPEKITGCLQLARELSKNIVVVYEPLTNKRQHEIKQEYKNLFNGIKKLYWVPTYLTREDPNQPVLTPAELIKYLDNADIAAASELDETLKKRINDHLSAGDLVVSISGGGGGSLDEWIRANF